MAKLVAVTKNLLWILPWLAGMLMCLWELYVTVSWYIAEGTFQQKAATLATTGTIVKITEQDGGENPICTQTISFVSREKQHIKFSPPLTPLWSPGRYCSRHVGDVVNVAYHVKMPQEAQTVPPNGPWAGNLLIFTIVIAGCGILFIAAIPPWRTARS